MSKRKKPPEAKSKSKLDSLVFGGKEYQIVYGKDKHLKQTVVGHELHDPDDYQSEVEAKFPEGWHNRLAKEFDKYLKDKDADMLNEGNTLFDLYKAWRDQCKTGFNRVDLEKLYDWLKEDQGKTMV